MSKIQNPVVLIHKRDNSDSYAVAITSGSQDYHDALLMASMEPDMHGDDVDTWSKTGYYMAQEIERWRKVAAMAIARLNAADDNNVWQAVGFALGALECAAAGEAETRRSGENVQEQNDRSLTITLPAMPVLGSQDQWYQGFAAGAGSMRDECEAALHAAGVNVEFK